MPLVPLCALAPLDPLCPLGPLRPLEAVDPLAPVCPVAAPAPASTVVYVMRLALDVGGTVMIVLRRWAAYAELALAPGVSRTGTFTE